MLNMYYNSKFTEMLPDYIKSKLIKLSLSKDEKKGKIEIVALLGENENKVRQSLDKIGGSLEYLGLGFGIITLNVEDIDKISSIEGISYFELPKILYTSYANSNKSSCVNEVWSLYGLDGEGVLIGFIDSGIDYTHPAFMDDKGETRIDYIYDLSEQGKIWNKQEINKAIKSSNPYEVVSERDDLGHGTHVAGIACAGGNIDKIYYGVAYKSSIAMVKITPPGKLNFTQSTQIMRGIKFLIDKAKELKKPLVINLSFSTNDGAHNGSSLFEQYISAVCNIEPVTFVISAGNEGSAAHHVGGKLRDVQNIDLNISPGERGVIVQFYKGLLSNINIEIKNPSGITTGVVGIKEGYEEKVLGNDKCIFYYTGPKPFDIDGETIISLLPNKEQVIEQGLWKVIIYLNNNESSIYDMWLPISEGLNPKTRFLQPDVFNTLGIPATVFNVISVGSYNDATDNISSYSGRGALDRTITKPDIVAPGENILSPVPGREFDSKTGTSMSAPTVSGIAALLMQWGMIKGNDVFLYGERLKYYLLKGARRNKPSLTYPNPTWGYGEVCAKSSLDLIISEKRGGKFFMGNRQMESCSSMYTNPEFNNYIVEYDGNLVESLSKVDFACGFILDENYAVVSVKRDRETELFSKIREIVYVEPQSLFTLSQVTPEDAANITKFHQNPYLTLTGRGVVVGIIDTGIDYLNSEFMYEDDTTRIDKIWDQTIFTGPPPTGFVFGTEYTKAQIDEAIKTKKQGGDPYKVVPSVDKIGHGTEMACIIGGRGRNPDLIGAAPECTFAVVKLKMANEVLLKKMNVPSVKTPTYENTDIVMGIKYLLSYGRSLNKPIVVYIPLGTNMGSHDGNSIIERYIDNISKTRGLVVVGGTGNQGDSDTHTSGNISKTGDTKTLEVKVSSLQKDLAFEIWISKPDKVSIGIVSPSGEVIEKVPAKLKESEEIDFVFEGSKGFIQYLLPEEITGDELIRVSITDIKEGIWQFRLIGEYIVNGKYDAWLPQRELLIGDTRFLNSNQYTTLMIPSTSRNIITTAYYDQNNNSVVGESGRGYTRDGRIKPDIASGGVNAKTTSPGGGTITVSGSSVGAAVLAGACALLMQWGIVDKKDITMYAPKIKTYLIRGASKRPGDIYPNTEWGYGMLNLQGVFENIRSILDTNLDTSDNDLDRYSPKFLEYNIGNMLVRIPLVK